MNINATLIIQAVNFFIAYLLLRFLFFKPVVAMIRQEQAQVDGLVSQLNEKRKAIHALELLRQEQWAKFQQEFRNRFPAIINSHRYVFKKLSTGRVIAFTDPQEIKQLEDELVQQIIQKVEHAHT
jgi:hypothetical protein